MIPKQSHPSRGKAGTQCSADKSSKVGGRRKKAGSDATAGNSVGTTSMGLGGNNATAILEQSKRFKKTRTRR